MYDAFKKLIPYMETKNIIERDPDSDPMKYDVRKILNLPKVEEIKEKLAEKVKNATLTSLPNVLKSGQDTDMDETRQQFGSKGLETGSDAGRATSSRRLNKAVDNDFTYAATKFEHGFRSRSTVEHMHIETNQSAQNGLV